MIPHPQQAKKIPGGMQDQGHEVVHHDQREGHQQPISLRSGSGSVPQGVKEVSHLEPKFHILVLLEIDPIPFLGLDLIDPRSSYYIITPCRMLFENENSAVKDKDQKLQKLND